MVGGTTDNDLATCELEVMKQKGKSNPKSKTFLIREEEGESLGDALESFSGETHSFASRGY
jgi:hypothetical protein